MNCGRRGKLLGKNGETILRACADKKTDSWKCRIERDMTCFMAITELMIQSFKPSVGCKQL